PLLRIPLAPGLSPDGQEKALRRLPDRYEKGAFGALFVWGIEAGNSRPYAAQTLCRRGVDRDVDYRARGRSRPVHMSPDSHSIVIAGLVPAIQRWQDILWTTRTSRVVTTWRERIPSAPPPKAAAHPPSA